MTGIAAVRAYSMQQSVKREKERILDNFAINPLGEHRAVTKVTKSLLLNAPYLLNGRYWDIIAKFVGAGVYSLKLKKM